MQERLEIVRLLGPAPAPIAALAPLVALAQRAAEELPASVKVTIDVDPGALL